MAASLFSSVCVARILGKDEFGMLSWATGLCTLLMAIANIGLDNVTTRDTARNKTRAREYLLSALLLKCFSSTACYLVLLAYLRVRGYGEVQAVVGAIVCVSIVVESMNYTCRAVLTGLERQDVSAVAFLLANLLRVAVVLILVYHGYHVVAVAWVNLATVTMVLGIHLACLPAVAKWSGRPTRASMQHLVAAGVTFLPTDVLMRLFDRADFLLLDIYRNTGDVGIYSAGYRVIEILQMIAWNSSLAVFPLLSRLAETSEEDYQRILSIFTKHLAALGFALCTMVYLLSGRIMLFLYSQQFAPSGKCLGLLVFSRVLAFAMFPGERSVVARDAQLSLILPVGIRTAVNVGLNLYLIPRYGYIGACIAMLVSENLYCAALYVIAFGPIERHRMIPSVARGAAAAMAMGIVFRSLGSSGQCMSAVAAVCAYLLAYALLGGFDHDDRRMLSRILPSGLGGRAT